MMVSSCVFPFVLLLRNPQHQVKDLSFGFFSPNNEPLLEREQRESYQCLDWLLNGVWKVGDTGVRFLLMLL